MHFETRQIGGYYRKILAGILAALGALHAIRESGLRCPRDVALTGFDGIPDSARTYPAITTVSVPLKAIAMAACTHLLRLIKNPPAQSEQQPLRKILPYEILVRDSIS